MLGYLQPSSSQYLNSPYDFENPYDYNKIRWDGWDTSRRWHWVAFGKSYEDIWNATVEANVNHLETFEDFVLKKIGKKQSDYWTEEGDYLEDEFDNDVYGYNMSDADYKELILSSKGNAYYS